MTYSDIDISVFAKLIQMNELSVNDAVNWAYRQYTEAGVEPWIEELACAYDKEDVLGVLRKHFDVSDSLSVEVRSGKVAYEYFHGKLNLQEAISLLLFDILIDLPVSEEKTNLYIAEDFYGWHPQAEMEALTLAKPILEKYAEHYEQSIKKFTCS